MKKKYKNNFTENYSDDIELKKTYLPVLYKRREYKALKYWNEYYQLNLKSCISQLQEIKNYEQYFQCEELTAQDYICAILIGFCGSLITTSEHLQEFLKLFHDIPDATKDEKANLVQKKVKNHSVMKVRLLIME